MKLRHMAAIYFGGVAIAVLIGVFGCGDAGLEPTPHAEVCGADKWHAHPVMIVQEPNDRGAYGPGTRRR